MDQEDALIPKFISLRDAGRRLGKNPVWIRGVADSLGIHLELVSRSLLMSRDDFLVLKDHVEQIEKRRAVMAC